LRAAINGRHFNFHAMGHLRWILFTTVILTAIAALLYGSYLVLGEARLAVPSILSRTTGKRILLSMEGFRLIESEGGHTAWVLNARTADLFESKEARLHDIEVVLSNPDGRTAALVGEQGTLQTETGSASIRRGAREVRIVTSDGYLMTTDSLVWNTEDRTVKTRDAFKVLGKDIYIEGTGLSADVDMRKVVVESNVKAVLQE
jgi:LPS export ABC transporter protein LptC